MQDKLIIGKQIKRLRARLKLTQDKLAEKVNISPKYLSNIERGLENPTLDTFLRLAKCLNVELGEIFLPDIDLNSKTLNKKIKNLINETNEEQLYLVMRLLQAVLH